MEIYFIKKGIFRVAALPRPFGVATLKITQRQRTCLCAAFQSQLSAAAQEERTLIEYHGKTLFTYRELRCPDTGIVQLAPRFPAELRKLRLKLGLPMIPNSACRSLEYNQGIGGHPRSLHVWDYPHWPTNGCCALDVSTHVNGEERSPGYRAKLIELAWALGWSIGLGEAFLHLDRRSDHIPKSAPQHRQVQFDY